ncbi:50S ribosomal protein L10 [Candidatus Peribacteria bacterium RIFCSPLOWO2_12_FULL_55_15]|nr:MAG: 50S ribosomal protein L10 [Candidatus Peribacteria bacterium RIFCSPHIGHO2_01_FULL_54_22]OGJ63174.1 MAG: 50S ribosomal protein L10 [Candidatus Peribacteria bacterium RIFCSPHIGHO2_02_FULL_55_24]OGJ64176.1 MAG: 50S ribosomal protein L10 [Candidatus Peribacteria bacterium RIFCSPHIGHO2_12_FULL_54_10]OGJ68274.1 MAG: 50S ribosomal protein L10 [Candidatus Peribacteria bacterium RIFCSPLOWO2_01_FULL_54_110]OGJ69163.1 MAG: 50S ribosomal protein L10 [Candidatus Peribacteria bacterium RIFCSPLOWO2_02
MALTRAEKARLTQDLTEKWKQASSIIFANYSGLSVANISRLRCQLKKVDAEMKVAKKTLLRRAAENLKNPFPEESDLPGPVACIFNYADPLSGARVAFAFGKEHRQFQLIGSIFEGNIFAGPATVSIAQIPPRFTLLQIFAGLCQAPLQQFASICSSPLQSFAIALQERAKQLSPSTP